MLDGVGLPPGSLGESVYAPFPTLMSLLAAAAPLDARLGVEGLPQSATGQTAILTGGNAAELLGRHLPGFPNAALRELLEAENIFGKLRRLGKRCVFANAYALPPEFKPDVRRRQSATTVAVLAGVGGVLGRQELLDGKAVYHDITRFWLRGRDGEVPEISEETAAEHLMGVFRGVDFCLFEYFLTDRAAHHGNMEEINKALGLLDAFLAALLERLDTSRELLLLVSDHGNIESPESPGHSFNPVPWMVAGKGAEEARKDMESITDVAGRIINLFNGNPGL